MCFSRSLAGNTIHFKKMGDSDPDQRLAIRLRDASEIKKRRFRKSCVSLLEDACGEKSKNLGWENRGCNVTGRGPLHWPGAST